MIDSFSPCVLSKFRSLSPNGLSPTTPLWTKRKCWSYSDVITLTITRRASLVVDCKSLTLGWISVSLYKVVVDSINPKFFNDADISSLRIFYWGGESPSDLYPVPPLCHLPQSRTKSLNCRKRLQISRDFVNHFSYAPGMEFGGI